MGTEQKKYSRDRAKKALCNYNSEGQSPKTPSFFYWWGQSFRDRRAEQS